MRAVTLAFAVTCLAASPAFAHWEYTRWNMTPQEVVAASSGAVRPVQGTDGDQVFELDLRAQGSYRLGEIDYEIRFFFTPGEGRLAAVKLIPGDGHCDALASRLGAAHGEGAREDLQIGYSVRWTDAAGDRVLFADIQPIGRLPRLCHVIYRPPEAGKSG